MKIATVTNFPHGNADIEIAVAETKAAVAYGADEVDVVFPYNALMFVITSYSIHYTKLYESHWYSQGKMRRKNRNC